MKRIIRTKYLLLQISVRALFQKAITCVQRDEAYEVSLVHRVARKHGTHPRRHECSEGAGNQE